MLTTMDSRGIIQRNNVTVTGTGTQPMMFAHGFGCDQNMWRFITPAFADDYKIILFDYVGSGKSDKAAFNAEKYSVLQGYARDVLDICQALELEDVIFVGHSVSSMIGLLASIENPQYFSKHIMIGPSPGYINDDNYFGGFGRQDIEGLLQMMDSNFMGWANFLAPNIIKNPERPELAAELTESFCSTDPVMARRFAEATFLSDNRGDLQYNKIETLLLQCSDDMVAPMEVGHYLAKHLPNSTLKVLKATGHCPHMSHPGEVIEQMEAFLKRAQ